MSHGVWRIWIYKIIQWVKVAIDGLNLKISTHENACMSKPYNCICTNTQATRTTHSSQTHAHTYTHTYVHTYIRTHKNNYTDTLDKCTLHTTQCKHRNTYKQICTNTSAYTQICTYTHKCIHIGILVHKYIIYTHMNIIT